MSAEAEGGLRIVWERPNSDGGDAIQNYVLESRTLSAAGGKWVALNVGFRISLPEFVYTDARPACEYVFRVAAMNRAGTGRPSETSEPFLFGTIRGDSTDESSGFESSGFETRHQHSKEIQIIILLFVLLLL